MRPAALVLAAAALLLGGARTAASEGYVVTARITHYEDSGYPMADGEMPYIGAIACSYDLPLGTWVVTPDGLAWQCLDRGLLYGEGTWLDFYGVDAESLYGPWADVEVYP